MPHVYAGKVAARRNHGIGERIVQIREPGKTVENNQATILP
jgi:hypothetical protein